jgi:hypothetical protein
MISMALAGVEVLQISPMTLRHAAKGTTDSTVRPRRKLKGVTIVFRKPGAPVPQRINYFSVDASNVGMARYPQFGDYLRGLAPTTTLIKSASYLLHVAEFKRLRNVLLDVSGFLVQDDTGVPYTMLTKRGWQLNVYGRYEVPNTGAALATIAQM